MKELWLVMPFSDLTIAWTCGAVVSIFWAAKKFERDFRKGTAIQLRYKWLAVTFCVFLGMIPIQFIKADFDLTNETVGCVKYSEDDVLKSYLKDELKKGITREYKLKRILAQCKAEQEERVEKGTKHDWIAEIDEKNRGK